MKVHAFNLFFICSSTHEPASPAACSDELVHVYRHVRRRRPQERADRCALCGSALSAEQVAQSAQADDTLEAQLTLQIGVSCIHLAMGKFVHRRHSLITLVCHFLLLFFFISYSCISLLILYILLCLKLKWGNSPFSFQGISATKTFLRIGNEEALNQLANNLNLIRSRKFIR